MRIAVVGGTGKEGRGMAARWAKAGHELSIGSRDAERAHARAAELAAETGGMISGGDNVWAVRASEVVVLAVPYGAHASTLEALAPELGQRVLIDITVPLAPPKITWVHLPAGQSAALEAQAILGKDANIVAGLHHVSSAHLSDLDHTIDCDVLACSDHPDALRIALELIQQLGVRAFDAGPLRNSIALEALTPVLLHMNKARKGVNVGIRITGA